MSVYVCVRERERKSEKERGGLVLECVAFFHCHPLFSHWSPSQWGPAEWIIWHDVIWRLTRTTSTSQRTTLFRHSPSLPPIVTIQPKHGGFVPIEPIEPFVKIMTLPWVLMTFVAVLWNFSKVYFSQFVICATNKLLCNLRSRVVVIFNLSFSQSILH